jgi:hypothetical protein
MDAVIPVLMKGAQGKMHSEFSNPDAQKDTYWALDYSDKHPFKPSANCWNHVNIPQQGCNE